MQKETERLEKAEYIAREIIAEARGRLVLHFPYLDQAIYGLRPLPLKSVPFGSDGSFLFYDPIFLIDQYERDENSAFPQDEAGLTKTFQTWPRGGFHIP